MIPFWLVYPNDTRYGLLMGFTLPETDKFCSVPNAARYISSCQSVFAEPKDGFEGTPVTVGTNARNSSAVSTSSLLATVLTE